MQQSTFGGYTGEYKGYLLKSSYEYILAKILENDDITYKYEEITYTFEDGTYYTPDFFLYNSDNILYEIIEIRGHRFGLEERIESLAELRKQLPSLIKTTLYTELDLRKMCKDRKLSYNRLKTYWRTNPDNIRGSSKGALNPMYGKHHTEESKELISNIRKLKVKENPEKYWKIGKQLEAWCRERNYDFLRCERVPRFTLKCEWCGEDFEVIQGDKDKRRFCSNQCGSEHALIFATEANIERRKLQDKELKDFILEWAEANKDIIVNTPFNKITPSLKGLLDLIEENFNIIDFRTISRSLGTKHRKDFLQILKDYVQQ